MTAARLIVITCLTSLATSCGADTSMSIAFDSAADAELFSVSVSGEAERRKDPPSVSEGRLHLLSSWWKSTAAVGFAAPTDQNSRSVEVSWTLVMNTGTEGAGFVWFPNASDGEVDPPTCDNWEAPDFDGAFGVGFDAKNPANRDPFRGSGNVYDRPQHEVSLHWDGREIVKRTTSVDFRDEQPHQVKLKITFVTGGARLVLAIGESPVFESYFIPGMLPYPGRPVFGARNDITAGDVWIDDLHVVCSQSISTPPTPRAVIAIDRQLNDAKHPKYETEVEFPTDTDNDGRIICTLRLDQPETRFDPWDRIAHIYVFSEAGERFELLRYITPYDRGHTWSLDVSDFRPFLQGRRKFEQNCSTQGEGWVVSVRFDFYQGPTDRKAYRMINLWSGAPEIGNPDRPVDDFYRPLSIPLEGSPTGAKVRLVVTGHGMAPNSQNAGEFMPIWRTLTVHGESFRHRLWKSNNYLNPCRPQGGTWKYDRAGWAPGDIVRPWEIDVSHLITDQETLDIAYALDEYINENRGQTWAPTHVTQSQLILYR